MTHVIPGTGGSREPDARFSSSHCAVRTLLGRSGSGRATHDQSGRKHCHVGNAERPSGRSAALAGAGLDSYSGTNDLQDGLEINRRACEVHSRYVMIDPVRLQIAVSMSSRRSSRRSHVACSIPNHAWASQAPPILPTRACKTPGNTADQARSHHYLQSLLSTWDYRSPYKTHSTDIPAGGLAQ